MSVPIRFLFIWLVMLALPLKGVAGISLVACAPQHHAATAVGTLADAAGEPSVPGLQSRAMPPSDLTTEASSPVVAVAPVSHHLDGSSAADKCGNCAPCCAAAAPATESALMVHPAPASTASADLGGWRVGFVTGAPERPPRRLAA